MFESRLELHLPGLVFMSSILYIVIGHHIYKTLWTPFIDEMLQVMLEDTDGYGEYIITIIKGR